MNLLETFGSLLASWQAVFSQQLKMLAFPVKSTGTRQGRRYMGEERQIAVMSLTEEGQQSSHDPSAARLDVRCAHEEKAASRSGRDDKKGTDAGKEAGLPGERR